MEEKELSYIDYVNVQESIVNWFKETLPTIHEFPVDYIYTQQFPNVDEDNPNALAIMFTPTATNYMSDFNGDFNKLSFMLQFKTLTNNSNDHIAAIKPLQFLISIVKDIKIDLGKDKSVLGLIGTMMPSMEAYIEAEHASIYSAMFELDYKQLRRF